MKRIFALFAVLLLLLGTGCGSNPFDPPADFAVTSGASRIALSWKSIPSIIGYNVYRGTDSGPVSTKTRIASGLTVTRYVDASAEPGITYYYQVTAVNSAGESKASAEVSASIKAAPAGDKLIGGALQGVPLTLKLAVTTVAGSATAGAADGSGTAAGFDHAIGITTDGKNLFVADTLNNTIRKIVIATGAVSTLAGSSAAGAADGSGSAARFNAPYGITTDGTNLFVSDFNNHMIRRIEIDTGAVTTVAGSSTPGVADGVGAAASFSNPRGITTDGTNLYVSDSGNRTIRKIVIASGAVTTLAGSGASGAADGTGRAAVFNNPKDITTDGTHLYLTDSGNNNIRRIDISTGAVSTLAGLVTALNGSVSPIPGSVDGIGAAAGFNNPNGITTDGTSLYVADSNNNLIRLINISTAAVSTIAGSGSAGRSDGAGTASTFSLPIGIATDGANLFVTDYNNSLIREIF